jgi:hypothetical protein
VVLTVISTSQVCASVMLVLQMAGNKNEKELSFWVASIPEFISLFRGSQVENNGQNQCSVTR